MDIAIAYRRCRPYCRFVSKATENDAIATRLEEASRLLRDQGANIYRVHAYERAAAAVRGLGKPVSEILTAGGPAALADLPGFGEHLARSVYQLATTGRLPLLDRLRGSIDPIDVIGSVPGIGERTAQRIHDTLGIATLEELEIAAHDGRLARIGVGAKRLARRTRCTGRSAWTRSPEVGRGTSRGAKYRRDIGCGRAVSP